MDWSPFVALSRFLELIIPAASLGVIALCAILMLTTQLKYPSNLIRATLMIDVVASIFAALEIAVIICGTRPEWMATGRLLNAYQFASASWFLPSFVLYTSAIASNRISEKFLKANRILFLAAAALAAFLTLMTVASPGSMVSQNFSRDADVQNYVWAARGVPGQLALIVNITTAPAGIYFLIILVSLMLTKKKQASDWGYFLATIIFLLSGIQSLIMDTTESFWGPLKDLSYSRVVTGTVLYGLIMTITVFRRFMAEAQEVAHARSQLYDFAATLERKVAARTADLEANNQKLESTVYELKLTQDNLIRSEKMAALGLLMAGIAHELNSPLGAIRSSATMASELLPKSIAAVARLVSVSRAEGGASLDDLLAVAATGGRSLSAITSIEERAAAKTAAARLTLLGLEDTTAQAAGRLVAQSGVPEILDLVEPFITNNHLLDILKSVAEVANIARCLDTCRISVERSSRIVFALRSYTQVQENEPFQEVSLAESLDQALALFAAPLRHGIVLKKHYESDLRVHCRPGNLGQVWVNLFQNAIQAMQGKGSLEIELRGEGGQAVVSIVDSGSGIPPEVQGRIFEPFFTTKRAGEGTGLGLDIVRKIVDAHSGRITFESVPGRTAFEVRFPMDAGDDRRGSN
jgi:signal transduction histidine kinase